MLCGKASKKYNALISKASALEAQLLLTGTSSHCEKSGSGLGHVNSMLAAVEEIAEKYVAAIDICDEDENLHRKLYCYSQILLLNRIPSSYWYHNNH